MTITMNSGFVLRDTAMELTITGARMEAERFVSIMQKYPDQGQIPVKATFIGINRKREERYNNVSKGYQSLEWDSYVSRSIRI